MMFRTRALAELVGLLATAADRLTNVEWFAHVGGLLDQTRTATDKDAVLELMRKSEHPVLMRDADAERLAERSRAR